MYVARFILRQHIFDLTDPALGSAEKGQKRKLKEKTDKKYSFFLAWLAEETEKKRKWAENKQKTATGAHGKIFCPKLRGKENKI